MNGIVHKLLGLRGAHYFASRFGWKELRSASFDEKFRNGDWIFSGENPDLVRLVEEHCHNGHILTLGCGTAPIAGALNPERFQSFLGVDLSTEAIHLARKHANEKVHFETGDMLKHRCQRRYDVILFPNSIYYVSWWSQKRLLRKLRRQLSPNGKMIITLAQPVRYAKILKMVRENFNIELDRDLDPLNRNSSAGRVTIFS
jgi:2-polyprenyl-3-methyl-5-hydroxy-6-metoxy-1,4-benzoquinol methylase